MLESDELGTTMFTQPGKGCKMQKKKPKKNQKTKENPNKQDQWFANNLNVKYLIGIRTQYIKY